MPRLFPASSCTVWPEVLPVDRIASDRLEDNTLADILLGSRGSSTFSMTAVTSDNVVAFHEATPSLIELRAFYQGKFRAATHKPSVAVGGCVNPDHKATYPAPSSPGRAPIEVVTVMAIWSVPLGAQALHPNFVSPALECSRACLYAPHFIRARNNSDLRVTNSLIAMSLCTAVVSDGRWLKDGFAAPLSAGTSNSI